MPRDESTKAHFDARRLFGRNVALGSLVAMTGAPLAARADMPQDCLVGTWWVQQTFSATNPAVPPPLRGTTEQSLFVVASGGVLSGSSGLATTQAGQWIAARDGAHTMMHASFNYDSVTHRVASVVTASWALVFERPDLFTVVRNVITAYIYDTTTGALLSTFQIVANQGDTDPAQIVSGQRVAMGWAPPAMLL